MKHPGVKGGNKKQFKTGSCLIFKDFSNFSNNYISFDNFKGYGESYKKSEDIFIQIRIDNNFYSFKNYQEFEDFIKQNKKPD